MKIDHHKAADWIKLIGAGVVTKGVMMICEKALEENTPEDAQGYKKFCVWAAGFALTGALVGVAVKPLNDAVDVSVKIYDAVVDQLNGNKPSGEELDQPEETPEQEGQC